MAQRVTPADEQDRAQVKSLAGEIQDVTGRTVKLVFVVQGCTGDQTGDEADDEGIALSVVKLDKARRGFVLLLRRGVVVRSFAWATRFRRLVEDYDRLPTALAGPHFVAYLCLMSKQFFAIVGQCP